VTKREELEAIWAEQDKENELSDALRDKIGENAWRALCAYNTYLSIRLGQKIEPFRREDGSPDYRLRLFTTEETREYNEGRVEDLS
jgi:hypothetical protein